MSITPDQIRYFITACHYMNFTRAAEELHLSQPGLSKAIRELEAHCGTPLWERRHNALILTPAGQVFLEQARKFQKQYETLEETARSLGSGETLLRIGLVPMCGNTLFPGLHRAFLDAFPRMRIQTTEATGPILYSLLEQHEIDVALCVTTHLPEKPYSCYVVKDSLLMLFVHKDHPLAGRKAVDLMDLAQEPLVLFKDTFGQTRYLRRLFAACQIHPPILHQTSQVFTILEYIRHQAAVGFLSEEFARDEKNLVAIPVKQIAIGHVNFVWNRNPEQFPALKRFLEFVKKRWPRQKQQV
ncbi:LysR family transcriptional regulator [Acidaminococcus timonensis]|uniref:LysR family transcriptional regulator n=1 Tax=Acidaminococcus timonensis TaxID=1871002 RepID=UPI0008DA3F23|nr:LysR family transcriptional regulator [Acidaminococcus timonensis]